jgi:hypothetical protein
MLILSGGGRTLRGLVAFGPLVALAAIMAAFASMYVLLGENPPSDLEWLFGFCQFLFVVYWMVLDARRRHRVPCHDFGFLAWVFLPVALPWYLIWTRGLRGLLVLVLFLILVMVPWWCATIVWMVKYGQAP